MRRTARIIAITSFAPLAAFSTANKAAAQDATTPYSHMAPVDQYLTEDKSVEIALARSAAPESISRDADVVVLGRRGFETAVKGKNGFVCIVGRSFTAAPDAEYWNPKVRVPMCVNAPAARSYLLHFFKWTELALAGHTQAQVNEAIAAAVKKKELPPMEPGAMCYMMSKQGYYGDSAPPPLSHLMFFYSDTDLSIWGANLPGSPVFGVADPTEHLTQFVVPAPRWSDGTEVLQATPHAHP